MNAYKNDPKLKEMLVQEAIEHRAMERLHQQYGYGSMQSGENFKGCDIGCTVFSLNRKFGLKIETNDHGGVASFLDVPVGLVLLFDRLFEQLPKDLAMTWQERHWLAIEPGSDQTHTVGKFLHWLLVDPNDGVIKFAKNDNVRKAIQAVADLFEKKMAGKLVTPEQWEVVRLAAAASASSASSAASAYAASASSDYASASAAASASSAAAFAYADAADAFAYAADAAARKKAFIRQAEKLLELMAAAPVKS